MSHHLERCLAQDMLNENLLWWNLMTQSCLFPMKTSLLTYAPLARASILPSPLPAPKAHSLPSQPLTLHIQTALDDLQAPENPRSAAALAFTNAAPTLFYPSPDATYSSKSDRNPTSSQRSCPVAQSPRAAGPGFQAAPALHGSGPASQAELSFLRGRGNGSPLCPLSWHSAWQGAGAQEMVVCIKIQVV